MTGQRGFTLIEVLIAAVICALMSAAVIGTFVTSDGVVQESRASLRAHETLRANIEAIGDLLRGADSESLGGFTNDVATAPEFRRVLGADAKGRVLGPTERLAWRSVPAVDGVPSAGEVVLVSPTGVETMAENVPGNGFRLRRQGTRLMIELSAYYTTSARRTTVVEAKTALDLRN